MYGTLRLQLEYAVHLWSPYQIGLREKLERSQRRATTLVRDRGDMIMTYNIQNHKVDMDARFMKMNTESRTRGHTKKLKINRSKIKIRRHFFTNRIKKMEWSKPRNHQFKSN